MGFGSAERGMNKEGKGGRNFLGWVKKKEKVRRDSGEGVGWILGPKEINFV